MVGHTKYSTKCWREGVEAFLIRGKVRRKARGIFYRSSVDLKAMVKIKSVVMSKRNVPEVVEQVTTLLIM